MANSNVFSNMDPILKSKIEESFKLMASINPQDVLLDLRPFLVIHKDGHIQRFMGTETTPPGSDPITDVESKDIIINPQTNTFIRLYKPPNLTPIQKIPLLIYFHGGGFCIETASSPVYHRFLNTLASQSTAIIASVDYRLAPENPLPAAYDDSWFAIKWIANHELGNDQWITKHVDFSRVFFGGDSAGANISHHMAIRVGKNPIPGMRLNGLILIHPYFWGEDRIGSELEKNNGQGIGTAGKLWKTVCPGTCGSDDGLINPDKDPDLGVVCCERILVLVAEMDVLRDRGCYYKEVLEGKNDGLKGKVEVVETIGENHVFHLMNPSSSNAADLMNKIVEFIGSNSG